MSGDGARMVMGEWVTCPVTIGHLDPDTGQFDPTASATITDLLVGYDDGTVAVLVQWTVPDALPWHDERHHDADDADQTARRRAASSLS